MMYYIDKVNTWSPANRKWKEVQSFALEFGQTLIPDEVGAKELVEELRMKVEELNEAYPRTQRIKVCQNGNFVFCVNDEQKIVDQYVFTFHIMQVKRTYEKGGAE